MRCHSSKLKNEGTHRIGAILVVMFIGPAALALPYHSPLLSETPEKTSESSASTVEVLRNMQKILSLTNPFPTTPIKTKFAKQAETTSDAEAEGAANALAYLTDSFGGQLAGQILSVILSSVTGDVRGILGNSLNLFQTDDRRDRVQFFLDDISSNFLKLTGLGALTTVKPPTGQSQSTPLSLLLASGPAQIHPVQPQQTFQIAQLGPSAGSSGLGSSFGGNYGTKGVGGSFGNTGLGGNFGSTGLGGTFGSTGLGGNFGSNSLGGSFGSGNGLTNSQAQLQQKPQQSTGGVRQPIIYVLPPSSVSQSASAGTSASSSATAAGSGTVGSKLSTGSRGSTSSNTADEDSDEDRQLF